MGSQQAADRIDEALVTHRQWVASTVRPLAVFATALAAAALAIALLSVASGREGVVFGPDAATRLLAFEVVAVAMLLALVSLGSRIRLTLQMTLVYLGIFLLLPGYHHSSANAYPFYNIQYEHRVRFDAAVMISAFIVAVIAGYLLGEQTAQTGRKKAVLGSNIFFPNMTLLFFLTALSIIMAVAYLATVGPAVAFGTRAQFGFIGGDKLSAGLLITLPRAITFLSFAYAFLLFRSSKAPGIGLFFLAANFVPFLVTNFPLTLPRFALFGIGLYFLVQVFDLRTARARLALSGIFVFGALVAMPIANELTRGSGAVENETVAQVLDAYLTAGDFDGLQSIQNALIYTEREGFNGGNQLLSAALFFVPRAIWAGKAYATGELTSRAAGYSFNNISQPLPSEFYVDFGMAGMIVGSLLFGILIARLDVWIDRNWQDGPRARLVAGVVVAFIIIFLRGSLLGIVAPIVVFAAGIFVIIRFCMVKPEAVRLRRRSRPGGEAASSPRALRHARALAGTLEGRR